MPITSGKRCAAALRAGSSPASSPWPSADMSRRSAAAGSNEVDYEAEPVAVIGLGGRYIPRKTSPSNTSLPTPAATTSRPATGKSASPAVSGSWASPSTTSLRSGRSWSRPTRFPTPQRLDVQLRLNGRAMQHSNTSHLIFPIARLIAYVSQVCTLCRPPALHRHAGRRRLCPTAAGVPQTWRRDRSRDTANRWCRRTRWKGSSGKVIMASTAAWVIRDSCFRLVESPRRPAEAIYGHSINTVDFPAPFTHHARVDFRLQFVPPYGQGDERRRRMLADDLAKRGIDRTAASGRRRARPNENRNTTATPSSSINNCGCSIWCRGGFSPGRF